jgi:hypothetical protein
VTAVPSPLAASGWLRDHVIARGRTRTGHDAESSRWACNDVHTGLQLVSVDA